MPTTTAYWVSNNNWTKEVLGGSGIFDDETNLRNLNYLINVDSTTNPALGCDKGFEATYQCGKYTNVEKSVTIDPEALGKTARFECNEESIVCTPLRLTLDDTGTLTLTDTDTGDILWTSDQISNQRTVPDSATALPEYSSVNGKYPRNYLLPGEFLNMEKNEWIGSPSGKFRLIMSSQGLQVVYNDYGCNKLLTGDTTTTPYTSSTQTVEETTASLLYELPDSFTQYIGNIGYINDKGQLQIYSEYAQQYVNTYEKIGNYDIIGGTLNTQTSSTSSDCESKCNSDPECIGFIFDTERRLCSLKNESVYHMPRIITPAKEYHLRNKGVNVDPSCPSGVINKDSSFWALANLSSIEMDSNSKCGLALYTSSERDAVAASEKNVKDNASTEFSSTVDSLMGKYTTLKNRLFSTKEDKNAASSILSNKNNELGDWNYKKYDQLKAMSEDTDLIMMSQNYRHIMWSILAIVLIIATMKIAK